MSEHRLPEQPDITTLLRGLLGREVTLTRADSGVEQGYTAIYVNPLGEPKAAVQFDLPLAASAGASLALIPAGQAEDWIKEGSLTGDGFDNAYEVLNVLAAAYNQTDESKHVKLAKVLGPGEAPDPAAAAVITAPATKMNYGVDIKGYPAGFLSVAAM